MILEVYAVHDAAVGAYNKPLFSVRAVRLSVRFKML